MRKTPEQQIEELRNEAARLQSQRKSAAHCFQRMEQIRRKQIRKANRLKEDDMSTLARWDKHTAPILRLIESNARWADKYARSVSEALLFLPERPAFETKAEEQLRQAEANLLTALERTQSALKAYGHKPVEQLQAAE